MTQFQNKTFSVHVGGDQEYRDNWDRIFRRGASEASPPMQDCSGCHDHEDGHKVSGPMPDCDECGGTGKVPAMGPLSDATVAAMLGDDSAPCPGEAQPACTAVAVCNGVLVHSDFIRCPKCDPRPHQAA